MSDNHKISVHLNLGGIPGRIQRVLRIAMCNVAIGLNAEETIRADTLAIPDVTIHHQFDASTELSIEEAKEIWRRWVLINGFRDIAEALNGLLEEVQSVLGYWELALIQKSKTIRVEDWKEIIFHRSKQFHRRTMPQKIEFLNQQYSFMLDETLIRQALTINAVRNCLTHRNGIVSLLDVDESGNLLLEWSALVLLATINGQEQEVSLPYQAKEGTEIALTTRTKKKYFIVGQSVMVNTEEFTQLCWTLFLLANSSAKLLENYGKEHGFEFKSNST